MFWRICLGIFIVSVTYILVTIATSGVEQIPDKFQGWLCLHFWIALALAIVTGFFLIGILFHTLLP